MHIYSFHSTSGCVRHIASREKNTIRYGPCRDGIVFEDYTKGNDFLNT